MVDFKVATYMEDATLAELSISCCTVRKCGWLIRSIDALEWDSISGHRKANSTGGHRQAWLPVDFGVIIVSGACQVSVETVH